MLVLLFGDFWVFWVGLGVCLVFPCWVGLFVVSVRGGKEEREREGGSVKEVEVVGVAN